ncbi:hypothetical protein NPIL_411391 [Nephila pilipes]|uniref:Uncharacterized protein n=1 Tax=Nephila pilipes TaxID=299642 RepID=A0A8X6MFU9_NEPPI|nr:hypothetical protein NPIL_411391 [Nephila pilipes]
MKRIHFEVVEPEIIFWKFIRVRFDTSKVCYATRAALEENKIYQLRASSVKRLMECLQPKLISHIHQQNAAIRFFSATSCCMGVAESFVQHVNGKHVAAMEQHVVGLASSLTSRRASR